MSIISAYIVAFDEYGYIASVHSTSTPRASVMLPGGQPHQDESPKVAALRLAKEQGWDLAISDDTSPVREELAEGVVEWYLGHIINRLSDYQEREDGSTPLLAPSFKCIEAINTPFDDYDHDKAILHFESLLEKPNTLSFGLHEDQQSAFFLPGKMMEINSITKGQDIVIFNKKYEEAMVFRVASKDGQATYIRRVSMSGKMFGGKISLPNVTLYQLPENHQNSVDSLNAMAERREKERLAEWDVHQDKFPAVIDDKDIIQILHDRLEHDVHGSISRPIMAINFMRMMDMIDKETGTSYRDIIGTSKVPSIDLWLQILDKPFSNFHRDAVNLWPVKWFNLEHWHPSFHMHIKLLDDITQGSPARCSRYVRFYVFW